MHITSAVNLPKTWGLYPLCAFTSICPGAVIPCYWHWNTTDWIPAWTHVPAIHGEEKQAAPVIFAHPWLLWHIVIKLNSFANKSKGRGACVVWREEESAVNKRQSTELPPKRIREERSHLSCSWWSPWGQSCNPTKPLMFEPWCDLKNI